MIPPITPLTATATSSPAASAGPAAASGATGAAGGDSFATLLGNAIDSANGVQQNATNLALAGATGQANVADVTVAATEAQLSIQLVTAVRDRAVTAFNSIMSMST